MKKLMMAAAIVCAVAFAQAASVDWNTVGSQAQIGLKVYLLTSYTSTYESLSAFEATAIDTGVIAKNGKAYNTGTVKTSDDAVTKTSNFYLAMVDTSDATKIRIYNVTSGMQAKVYDPSAQESSKGTFSGTTTTTILSQETYAVINVPEPTSGLLLLLGMAGLALRRRRA